MNYYCLETFEEHENKKSYIKWGKGTYRIGNATKYLLFSFFFCGKWIASLLGLRTKIWKFIVIWFCLNIHIYCYNLVFNMKLHLENKTKNKQFFWDLNVLFMCKFEREEFIMTVFLWCFTRMFRNKEETRYESNKKENEKKQRPNWIFKLIYESYAYEHFIVSNIDFTRRSKHTLEKMAWLKQRKWTIGFEWSKDLIIEWKNTNKTKINEKKRQQQQQNETSSFSQKYKAIEKKH